VFSKKLRYISKIDANWKNDFNRVVRLALPLGIAQLISIGIMTSDIWIMGRLSSFDLAAGGLAIRYYQPFYFFALGMLVVISSLTSQALGAKDLTTVRRVFRQGMAVAIIFGFIMAIPIIAGIWLLPILGQDPILVNHATPFLIISAFTLPLMFLFLVMRFFSAAYGKPYVQMLGAIIALICNVIGNELLTFGIFNIPALGLAGIAISTAISFFIGALSMALIIGFSEPFKQIHPFRRLWVMDWQITKKILKIGMPTGVMVMSETGMFAVASIMMGVFGTAALAATAIATQFAGICFMIPLSIAQASSILIGRAAGSQDIQTVSRISIISMILGVCVTVTVTILIYIYHLPLIKLFLRPDDPLLQSVTNFAIPFLLITALFQIADGTQAIASAILRGINDTAIPALIGFICFWGGGLFTGYLLAFKFGVGPNGIWFGIATGLTLASIVLTTRYIKFLKKMKDSNKVELG
jgi:multidrug resistance protein, MATE family